MRIITLLIGLAIASPAIAQPAQVEGSCPNARYRDQLNDHGCDYSEFIRFCHGDDCDKSEELIRSRRNPAYLVPKSQMPNGLPIK